MNKKYLIPIFIFLALVVGLYVGFYFGRLLASDNFTTNYSCNQIARFHADRLIKDFNIRDGFNTSPENPKGKFNQKASDLNFMILQLCNTNPENVKPGLKQMIEEQSYPR